MMECPLELASMFAVRDYVLGLNKPQVILFDLDGVIIDHDHRLPFIVGEDGKNKENGDWDAFHAAAHLDTSAVFAPFIAKLLEANLYTPVFLTARVDRPMPEGEPTVRDSVLAKIFEVLNLDDFPHEDSLIMRPHVKMVDATSLDETFFHESSAIYKARVASLLLGMGIDIALAVDDSHKNCVALQALGIPVMRAYNHVPKNNYGY